jgi:hypothetical protein
MASDPLPGGSQAVAVELELAARGRRRRCSRQRVCRIGRLSRTNTARVPAPRFGVLCPRLGVGVLRCIRLVGSGDAAHHWHHRHHLVTASPCLPVVHFRKIDMPPPAEDGVQLHG